MTGFELQTSGIGSDRSTNWATTTAQYLFTFYVYHPTYLYPFCHFISTLFVQIHFFPQHKKNIFWRLKNPSYLFMIQFQALTQVMPTCVCLPVCSTLNPVFVLLVLLLPVSTRQTNRQKFGERNLAREKIFVVTRCRKNRIFLTKSGKIFAFRFRALLEEK